MDKDRLVSSAIYIALCCAALLAGLKYIAYIMTGAISLFAMMLDSILDTLISISNLIMAKITRRSRSKLFVRGFDKIVPLVVFFQSIFIFILASYLLVECVHKLNNPEPLIVNFLGIAVIIVSIFINMLIVGYQSYVVHITNSIIIKADMLHYKTDFLTNIGVLSGILCVYLFDASWVDPFIGLCATGYLYYAVFSLMKLTLSSLLDLNKTEIADKIDAEFKKNSVKCEVFVLFTGRTDKVFVKIKEMSQFEQVRAVLEKSGYEYEMIVS